MDSELTPQAKSAIRADLLSLIMLPGLAIAVISFLIAFLIKDVAQSKANFEIGNQMREMLMNVMDGVYKDVRDFSERTLEERHNARKTLSEITALNAETQKIQLELRTLETFRDSGQFIQDIADLLRNDSTFQTMLVGSAFESGAIRECRVCFRETEGSSQCQGNRDSCSGWSTTGSWTEPFRDDTDNRAGGCTYQWRMECK